MDYKSHFYLDNYSLHMPDDINIPEVKECAVPMPIETTGDYPSNWSAIQAIALTL